MRDVSLEDPPVAVVPAVPVALEAPDTTGAAAMSGALVSAFVGLGSNLGDRRATLERAIGRLDAHGRVAVREVSPWLENPAQGGPTDQPDYLNGVLRLETDLAPLALLSLLLEIERDLGRDRASNVRNAPRTLDLDLLLYGSEVLREEDLVVPHPRMLERDFVLAPLARIAPRLRLPQTGRRVLEEAHRLALRRIAETWDAGVRPTSHEPVA
jgi:2-amino-4-hydroxy-6-hydroxymethyldihydropteridine diphosphokinase